MVEVERIDDQMRRSFEGDAWHGAAVREVLQGVTAEQAAARPIAGAHTIWEIVLHIATWQEVARRRLDGEEWRQYATEEDWPPVPDETPEAWRGALERLEGAHRGLRERVLETPDARLDETVPRASFSFYVLLHGVVQHDLYHTGQIALLKKALVADSN